ncbi:hypothetical protein QBC33DRAFT_563832 [Phialemonium atrogriseum]|uniref:Uncharacterized protein n=1 Tax=Phialemonium atrogriseum TaxID=1093897 RepID=A0AAJ0BSP2_9PEZI|nr:uncharacterized protein QBC33DRAFT_563832 [Phialemonium atrogriseum]KAK1762379.1 hypothetical protein QBC33DRAFT_563832 [Phialemonium atrogriseum]
MAAPFVWIGAFPGTASFIDNHQLVDPVAAREAGRPFLPVYRSGDVDVDANIRRAASHDRVHGTTTKLTDRSAVKISAC